MNRKIALGLIVAFATAFVAQADEPKAPEGFTPLFDGKDLTGWKAHNGKLDQWGVEGGVIFCKGGGGGWLLTEKEFGNFELKAQFRWSKEGGNSGVALRTPFDGDPAYKGMEVQLIDDENWAKIHKFELKDTQHTGSIYNVQPSAKRNNKPIGEWNDFHAICNGSKIVIKLNGETITETDLADHKEKKAKSNPGILREKGSVGFQSYNQRVEFRNIYLKPLK